MENAERLDAGLIEKSPEASKTSIKVCLLKM